MLVDSHCHIDTLNLDDFEGEVAKVIELAQANDVSHFLCVCIDLENFPNVLSVAEQYDFVSASVGVHPNVTDGKDPSIDELIELAAHPKIVAIGETGLDYYRTEDKQDWQQQRFRRHINAAKQLKKPLIIHTRQAREDTIQIMIEENAAEVGGVMHCFTENWEMAEKAIAQNFYISFSGIVTFKNAKELQEVAQKVPLDRMLIETDSPYLAPVPHRGQANQPAYVKHVAEFIAELRGISYQELATATTNNYFNLFKEAKR